MKEFGCPVVLDATHSLQLAQSGSRCGPADPDLIRDYSPRLASQTGCDGIFIETPPHPATAKSLGANMLQL